MTVDLTPGFYDVPPGMVAAVVTYLEMTARPPLRPAPDLAGIALEPLPDITSARYRDLFERVGAQDWLWFSRMAMSDEKLSAILNAPDVEVFTLAKDGVSQALLELDFRVEGACELAFFGVAPALIGTGAGRVLMNHAIELAWARPIRCLHVHTCTLDHPGALAFYQRSGFVPLRQQIEIAPDPRLTGVLPETAGPHVPMFRP
ncbi:GNAT family N-acetyltransferase [Aestuariivita sp.]|uniref:GNAT family N-acetyltransferase n=1 Tax=Aestuariivita sp. TaxID=1872407 RepID=UPI003BB07FB6